MGDQIIPLSLVNLQMQETYAAAKEELAAKVSTQDRFIETMEEAFNPAASERQQARLGRFRSLERRSKPSSESKRIEKVDQKAEEDLAKNYSRRNPELDAIILRKLRESLKNSNNPDEILKEVLENFPDPTLADEALEYLEQSFQANAKQAAIDAKNYLNTTQKREIVAGRNVSPAAQEFHDKGLGASATQLRDLYRNITVEQRTHNALFSLLADQYPFNQLKMVVAFLLKGMAYDLKAKGPSIQQQELMRLMTELRNLQSILWVYMFFKARMKLIKSLYAKYGCKKKKEISFEDLAKAFIALVEDRYPTAAKLVKQADTQDLTDEEKIIIFMQYRDALSELSLRLYRSPRHRQDLLMVIVEALEELEEQFLEEE